jgi:hypothetical protein
VAHTPDSKLDTGCVQGHTPRMYTSCKLTSYEIYQLLYVNNGAFPFPTHAALIKGLALVHSHLAHYGLKVHIGQNGYPSKTECIFFPPPQFFDGDHNSATVLTDGVNEPWLVYQDPPLNPYTPHNATTVVALNRNHGNLRVPKLQGRMPSMMHLQKLTGKIADGYVTFCWKFKYLGSCISYNLQDDDDIEAQLAAANQSMGTLKEVWCNPHFNMYSKYLLFRAIPMDLLLWGCKNWSLRQALLWKLEVFLHCSIQRILHISIVQVQECHIRNEKIYQMFMTFYVL